MDKSFRPVWVGAIGFALFLTGVLLLGRIGWNSRSGMKYPLVGSVPGAIASTNTFSEASCDQTAPQSKYDMSGNALPSTPADETAAKAQCLADAKTQRDQTRSNDLAYAGYLTVLGLGLIWYQRRYIS